MEGPIGRTGVAGMMVGADGLVRAPARVPGRRAGRRVSPAMAERFLAIVREQGLSIPTACAMTGISTQWVELRRAADPRFADALAQALMPSLGEVYDAVKTAATQRDDRGRFDVRAQELFLTLHDPAYRRGRRELLNVAPPSAAVQVNVAPVVLTAEERQVVAEIARRRLGIGPGAQGEADAAGADEAIDVACEPAQPSEHAGPGAAAPCEAGDAAGD